MSSTEIDRWLLDSTVDVPLLRKVHRMALWTCDMTSWPSPVPLLYVPEYHLVGELTYTFGEFRDFKKTVIDDLIKLDPDTWKIPAIDDALLSPFAHSYGKYVMAISPDWVDLSRAWWSERVHLLDLPPGVQV